jgi:MerC mercury resistance protein
VKVPLDKFGSIGALVAAAACPVCFPKLALIGAVFGLGALGAYESQLVIAAQLLVGVAVLGHVLAYRRHRRRWLPGLAIGSAVAVFAGLYALEWLAYAGFAGLIAASIADLWQRLPRRTRTRSVLTCPECGHLQKETMPADACQFFYECKGCGKLLRPKPGDCCVFCSYGTVRCPPMQVA